MTAATPHRAQACLLAVTVLAGCERGSAGPGGRAGRLGDDHRCGSAAAARPRLWRTGANAEAIVEAGCRDPGTRCRPAAGGKGGRDAAVDGDRRPGRSAPERGRRLASMRRAGRASSQGLLRQHRRRRRRCPLRLAEEDDRRARAGDRQARRRSSRRSAPSISNGSPGARSSRKRRRPDVVTIYSRMKPDAAAAQLAAHRRGDGCRRAHQAQSAHRQHHPQRDGAGAAARLTATIAAPPT